MHACGLCIKRLTNQPSPTPSWPQSCAIISGLRIMHGGHTNNWHVVSNVTSTMSPGIPLSLSGAYNESLTNCPPVTYSIVTCKGYMHQSRRTCSSPCPQTWMLQRPWQNVWQPCYASQTRNNNRRSTGTHGSSLTKLIPPGPTYLAVMVP